MAVIREEDELKADSDDNAKGKKRRSPPGCWDAAIKKYRWKERALFFDKHIDEQEQQKWEERYKQFREEQWKVAETLMKVADRMAAAPLYETIVENGLTTIAPVKWTMRDLATFYETSLGIKGKATNAHLRNVDAAIDYLTAMGYEVSIPSEKEEGDDLEDEQLEEEE